MKYNCLGSPVWHVSATLHVKELRWGWNAFLSLLRLHKAALRRRDGGPELLVSAALLVAFSREQVGFNNAC